MKLKQGLRNVFDAIGQRPEDDLLTHLPTVLLVFV